MQTKLQTILSMSLLGLASLLLVGCGVETSMLSFSWGFGLCSTVIFILDIIAIIEVLGSNRSTGDKVLWCLLIFFFPFLGLILYYFFGRK